MFQNEENKILEEQIVILRNKSYKELCTYLNRKNNVIDAIGDSGKKFNVEINVFFDSKSSKNIRVIVAVDDGGLRSVIPRSSDFIMSPDGNFIGE